MGLDMSLVNKQGNEIAYWRKANCIHKWFCDNVNATENLVRYLISKEDIEKLLSVCREVAKNPNNASNILPTMDGFFFGDTSYDDMYFYKLNNTIKVLKEILLTFDFENDELYYIANW